MSKIERVLFIGSKQLGLRVLEEIYVLSPDSLIGILTIDDTNDTRTMFGGFQTFSSENEMPLHVAENRKHSEDIIRELNPDLCLVVGWYWLISERTIEDVPFGLVGIHNSSLPKFRGGSPLIWQMIANEPEIGFSFFTFTPDMDEGPIWAHGSVPVDGTDYVSDVLEKLERETLRVLRDTYPSMLRGSISPTEQNHAMATYCAQRYPNDGNIDWQMPARDVCRFVRAQSDPYPGAFTYLENREFRIWRAAVFEHQYFGTPGQVARIDGNGVYVICGDNRAIILEDVELSGKRGRANEFIKSIKVRLTHWNASGPI